MAEPKDLHLWTVRFNPPSHDWDVATLGDPLTKHVVAATLEVAFQMALKIVRGQEEPLGVDPDLMDVRARRGPRIDLIVADLEDKLRTEIVDTQTRPKHPTRRRR